MKIGMALTLGAVFVKFFDFFGGCVSRAMTVG